jgi:hypothetical protein
MTTTTWRSFIPLNLHNNHNTIYTVIIIMYIYKVNHSHRESILKKQLQSCIQMLTLSRSHIKIKQLRGTGFNYKYSTRILKLNYIDTKKVCQISIWINHRQILAFFIYQKRRGGSCTVPKPMNSFQVDLESRSDFLR